jgi:hypothetical protein
MRVSIVRRANALATLLLVGASTSAYAHDEDHTSSPPASIASTPRAEAVSEHFELVAVARHGVLTIYLDRLRSNDPVAGATVTVETPAGSLDAVAAHDGTYSLAAPWSTQAGRHDLIFTVVSGGSAEVLTGTLQVPSAVGPDAEGSAPSSTSSTFLGGWKDRIVGSDLALVGAALGGFVLGALVVGALGRRKAAPAAVLLAILVALVVPAARTRATITLWREHRRVSVISPNGRLTDVVRPQADATPACRPHRHHGKRRSSPHDRIAGTDHPIPMPADMWTSVGGRLFWRPKPASEARHARTRVTSSPT